MAEQLKPWETVEFPWGGAVRHRKGKWTHINLFPDGQEIKVDHLNVELTDDGIIFLGE